MKHKGRTYSVVGMAQTADGFVYRLKPVRGRGEVHMNERELQGAIGLA